MRGPMFNISIQQRDNAYAVLGHKASKAVVRCSLRAVELRRESRADDSGCSKQIKAHFVADDLVYPV